MKRGTHRFPTGQRSRPVELTILAQFAAKGSIVPVKLPLSVQRNSLHRDLLLFILRLIGLRRATAPRIQRQHHGKRCTY